MPSTKKNGSPLLEIIAHHVPYLNFLNTYFAEVSCPFGSFAPLASFALHFYHKVEGLVFDLYVAA